MNLTKVRDAWKRAAAFPADKEVQYPEHADAQEFEQHHDLSILEYGCGSGSDTVSYLRRGNHVTFADIVPENVEETMKRVESVFGTLRMTTTVFLYQPSPLPFHRNDFDLINAHGVLHHIEDPNPVVAEFRRVVIPGGWVYVMLYTEKLYEEHRTRIDQYLSEGVESREEAFAWCTDGVGIPYATFYTEEAGRDLLTKHGLTIQRVVEYNKGFFRTFKARR